MLNEIRISDEGIVHVELGRGHVAMVDLDTWNERKMANYRWRPVGRAGHIYAYTNLGGMVYMHRFIMNPSRRRQVDHINHVGLDNRRANLRIVTPAQNRANSRKEKNNVSGFKGVSWSPTSKKWSAKITVGGKRHYLGVYAHKERAAMAVDRAALALQGDFAALNFEDLREGYRASRARVPKAKKVKTKVYCAA